MHKLKRDLESYKFRVVWRLNGLLGFRVYRPQVTWDRDQDFKALWADYPEKIGHLHDRRHTLYSIARSLQHVDGELAECGVYRGASSFLMLKMFTDGRFLHIFDSFEGLSDVAAVDIPAKSEKHIFPWKKHDLAVSEDVVHKNLAAFKGRYKTYKGWIPDRFEDVADKKFALVHIDVDLYQPTLDSLKFFYPRMATGGMIVCDDYGFNTCPGARKAFDEFLADKPEKVIHLTTAQGLMVKQ